MEAQWTIYTGVENFRSRDDIVRVRMAPNVTEVRNRTFMNCPNLKEVDLGNVTKIGWCSFMDCPSLIRLRLPPTVIELGDDSFSYCVGLERVDLGNVAKIGINVFAVCKGLVEVDLSHLELLTIGILTFSECNRLKHVTLPSTLVAIEKHAFSHCAALQRVELPNGLQKIGEHAFAFCGELETLIIPSTLMDIGKAAFGSCSSLRAVYFSQGVHHVAEGAFDQCLSLRGLKVPPNAFVIEWGTDPSCVMAEDTTIPRADGGVERTVVSGNFGQSEHLLAEVEEKINGILGRQSYTIEEKLGQIRSMIVHVKMVDATTCLELALLKATMEKEQNLTREKSRVICGAEIIIPNVLSFLDGS